MTEMKVTLDPEEIKAAMREAVFATLTPEVRDKLIKHALESLMKGTWQSPSEMQQIFSRQAELAAGEIMRQEMEKPERKEQLQKLVVEAFDKAFTGEMGDKLVERVATAIATALTPSRY